MTLPFRGRHHDGESTHERARTLASEQLLTPLAEDDAAWLARHLDACGECRAEDAAWQADRALLRSLRDRPLEPPRDLWARTSAAIDREAGSARRRRRVTSSGRAAGRDLRRGLPFGAATGALVVAIVVGASLLDGPTQPQGTPSVSNPVAVASPQPQPTNIAVAAAEVGWLRQAANGTWELVLSDVEEVCPRAKAGCEDFGGETAARPLNLGDDATGLTISPDAEHLVVQSRGSTSKPGKVYVVPVPSERPAGTPAPPTEQPSTLLVTPPPSPEGTPVLTPSDQPTGSPSATPPGAIEIASGVTMVGEAAYNEAGTWLAFSARPADGSTGPDLYLWRVGDAQATPVTTDHATYFSSWRGEQVLASRISTGAPAGPSASAQPGESGEPGQTSEPAGTPEPAGTAEPGASPDPTLGSPDATPAASDAGAVIGSPTSFLMDPETLVLTELTESHVWLPVVDRAGDTTVYWSGTLMRAADGLEWQLGEGDLVLDEWIDPGNEPAGETPEPSASARVVAGPAGKRTDLPVGAIETFQAKFDPDGLRVAIWAAEEADAEVGRLHLVVLDSQTGAVDPSLAPLPGEPALRRFSIDTGRLAWVSPRGQDGQESAVQVLGWVGREFGEIQTIPAKDLFIVR